MMRLVIESWFLLLRADLCMRFRDFKVLCNLVQRTPVQPVTLERLAAHSELCHAVDLASVFYFKPVLCLQRATATTILLRRHGWHAETVIGAQVLPFRSHAWVEIEGIVVNDKPYMLDIYQVLNRY